ncbi:hypothetical protein WA026_023005, partial [Henosepilachna vigintioctopunctata]
MGFSGVFLPPSEQRRPPATGQTLRCWVCFQGFPSPSLWDTNPPLQGSSVVPFQSFLTTSSGLLWNYSRGGIHTPSSELRLRPEGSQQLPRGESPFLTVPSEYYGEVPELFSRQSTKAAYFSPTTSSPL